jgi:hypothetical protein
LILNDIQEKLKEIDNNVFYGMVDNSMNETLWNYIVFNRNKLSINQNKISNSEYYSIHIIRENFIPEGLEEEVINKMIEINGFRVAGDGTYNYVEKPNTNVVVEMFSIDFVRPKKV